MTRSLYVVGGAGVGKSTFMQEMLEELDVQLSEQTDLHSKPNKKALVTLRGHVAWSGHGKTGLYLGCMRDSFPGTDGLDRASSPTGAEWLRMGNLPDFIIAEGATLATRPFLTALAETTDLLLVHLVCDPDVKRERLLGRGSNQAETFILGTESRSANLVRDMRSNSVAVLGIDTGSEADWEVGLDICVSHVLGA